VKKIWLITLILLSSCSHRQQAELVSTTPITCSDYFLVILTSARQIDYSNNQAFFRTLTKHPSDGTKNCDVGHAWIYLHGKMEGQCAYLEGGHSGELGTIQPTYFQGIVERCQSNDPNPAKYLWAIQKDGFFQEGSGGHRPTFAAKVNLSPEQFHEIMQYIQNYNFQEYSIVRSQCSTFVTEIAEIAGLTLEHRQTMYIDPILKCGRERYRLWNDPKYSCIRFSSPDVIEKSLKCEVSSGQAEYALPWYRKNRPQPKRNLWRDIVMFPERLARHWMFR